MVAVELGHSRQHPEPCANRALRVVAVGSRRAEDCHHRVADVLLQDAAVLFDVPSCPLVEQPERLADVLGVGVVGTRRRPDEVDEQDGDDLPLLVDGLPLLERRPAAAAEPCVRGVLDAAGRGRSSRRQCGGRESTRQSGERQADP